MTSAKKKSEKVSEVGKIEEPSTVADAIFEKEAPAVKDSKRAVIGLFPTRGYAVVTDGGEPYKIAYHIRRASGVEVVAPLKGGVTVPFSDWLSGRVNF